MTILAQEQSMAAPTVCRQHPTVETGLHCNRCDRPICPKCARRTVVGYKCDDCIRQMEGAFFNGGLSDYLIAALIALPLSVLVMFLFTVVTESIGWFSWMIALAAAPRAAGMMTTAIRWGARQRRARYLARVVAVCMALSALPFFLYPLLWSDLYGVIGLGIFGAAGIRSLMAELN